MTTPSSPHVAHGVPIPAAPEPRRGAATEPVRGPVRPTTPGGVADDEDTLPRRPRGRPPLSEQARADLRLKIAREAVGLFRENGVARTTVAQIASAAGISQRTFWRYFPAKEDCIRPVAGQALAAFGTVLGGEWPSGTRLIEHAFGRSGPQREGPSTDDALAMLDLIRLVAENEQRLTAAWLAVHVEAETSFAVHLGDHFHEHPESLRMRVYAAMLNGAIRAGVDHAVQENGAALDTLDLAAAFQTSLAELPF